MKKFGIYKITCKVNNKIYIGSTGICFKQRFKKHKQRLRNNYHENDYLQKSWNKYGESAFIFEIIEECEIDNLLNREQFFIDSFIYWYFLNSIHF